MTHEPAGDTQVLRPRRGEVWLANLNPTLGHEQAGRRPILVVSVDAYNAGSANLIIALPLTSKVRLLPDRVSLVPPEGGLKVHSDILCGQTRAISQERMLRRWGQITPVTLNTVVHTLRLLLGI